MIPQYPVYVVSKGRAKTCLTARFLIKDGTPFRIVVEPQEVEAYAKEYGRERILALPFSNLGQGSIPARNWIWEHSKKAGFARHWILDDNILRIRRLFRGKRIPCNSGHALAITEHFVDRYENVALAGLNYLMFVLDWTEVPFYHNVHIYSCFLILNSLPYRWRGRYNEDTDLCLQALSSGWCTILLNVFMIHKIRTMTMKGGNTDELYKGDGRLKMARALERMWPGVVTVDRRYGRPQHVVKGSWKGFDTPLKRRPNVKLPKDPEFGLKLKAVAPVKSKALRRLVGKK